MIIHEDNVRYGGDAGVWEYYVPDVGSGNEVYIRFTCAPFEDPRTGDKIVNNKLVKSKDD